MMSWLWRMDLGVHGARAQKEKLTEEKRPMAQRKLNKTPNMENYNKNK